MAYTTIDKPDDYFNTVLWTGTGSAMSITGVGFQPDWVWITKEEVLLTIMDYLMLLEEQVTFYNLIQQMQNSYFLVLQLLIVMDFL
jgi:hypothetical protein